MWVFMDNKIYIHGKKVSDLTLWLKQKTATMHSHAQVPRASRLFFSKFASVVVIAVKAHTDEWAWTPNISVKV